MIVEIDGKLVSKGLIAAHCVFEETLLKLTR
jgi:hypothetical protein